MISGQVVVITNGAAGLGRGLTEALAGAGARLLIGDVAPDAADRLAAELSSRGVFARGVQLDPSDATSAEVMVEVATSTYGRVDALVNVQVVSGMGAAVTISLERFLAGLDINLTLPFFASRMAARQMLAQLPRPGASERGYIVNVSSVAGVVAVPGALAFGSAMAALNALTKSLAVEWREHGIRVVGLGAGLSAELADGALPDAGSHHRIPPGALTQPADAGAVLLSLLGDSARHISGSTVYVDGGWLADGYWE